MEVNLNLNLNIDKNKEFYKTIAAITIPIALQNIISYSVNLMDTVMLGRLGEVALLIKYFLCLPYLFLV